MSDARNPDRGGEVDPTETGSAFDDAVESRIDDLVARVEQIAEDMADLALSLLSDEVGRGGGARPEAEKRLTRARRTLERAVHQLRGVTND